MSNQVSDGPLSMAAVLVPGGIQQSSDLHPGLRRTARPNGPADFRDGYQPPLLPPGGSGSRGPITRPVFSAAEADAMIAQQAAQAGAAQALDVGVLQSRVKAQEAVIAELKRSNAALAARLDAIDGIQGDAA